ncbi:hypothetical protein [Selenomonas sp. F0473]|uniref:hypothetical protein n=1 Tax=Selenomonas sp. F0473 TaxID=999423 RepID=UPI0025E86619|nr:hypothetical protein [Selenomonas sp. F0473]
MRMRRLPVRGFLLAVFVLLAGLGVCEAAEDMQFVDADDDTGYYVDAATIVRVSDAERDAVIAVVKISENRRYLYRTRFNREKNTYQFFSAQVEVYDTKEVLRTLPGMDVPQPYTPSSPMRSIVDFIEEFLTAKQQSTK